MQAYIAGLAETVQHEVDALTAELRRTELEIAHVFDGMGDCAYNLLAVMLLCSAQ